MQKSQRTEHPEHIAQQQQPACFADGIAAVGKLRQHPEKQRPGNQASARYDEPPNQKREDVAHKIISFDRFRIVRVNDNIAMIVSNIQ